ncbi:MerR family DNA-binding transcriptional regulator [Paenibacillus elgii]|uniref:MerR family DNA-binding transcriptional regulator n=1 Tax=Paenibacillus elgii TaxID=189691 RepID=UPI001E2F5BB1|nr:MerR family DNA-binding transcriptional regulator [Paenibacillus elgii]
MYSISDIARLSGITAFTLRYYEKIGVLPKPRRQAERRPESGSTMTRICNLSGLFTD